MPSSSFDYMKPTYKIFASYHTWNRQKSFCLRVVVVVVVNPLCLGVSDPGNIPGGGPKDPQLSFGFSGFLYAP